MCVESGLLLTWNPEVLAPGGLLSLIFDSLLPSGFYCIPDGHTIEKMRWEWKKGFDQVDFMCQIILINREVPSSQINAGFFFTDFAASRTTEFPKPWV